CCDFHSAWSERQRAKRCRSYSGCHKRRCRNDLPPRHAPCFPGFRPSSSGGSRTSPSLEEAMTLDPKSTLGELATAHPVASRVFQAHQLDYCCGGGRSLEEACARKGLDPASILDEIAAEESVNPDLQSWVGRPLDQIIQHIVDYCHARLRRELPELESLAMRVEHRHALHPDVPDGLAHILRAMQEDVFDHLAKEERILFPLIAAGRGAEAGGPIHAMEAEHE